MFIKHYIELLYCLVLKELKVRYNYSIFGYLWALGNPIAFAIIYYFAFKIILRVEMENYSVFLLCGMFPWVLISNSIIRSTMTYRSNVTLVKRIKIPLSVLPLSNILQEAVHFMFSIPILVIFVYFNLNIFFIEWFYQIPLLLLIQIFFLYSISQILAILNVFIKDVEYLTTIMVNMAFFLTPVIYPISFVPEKYTSFFYFSPFSQIIINWRSVFLEGVFDYKLLLFFLCISIFLFAISRLILKRYQFKMSEVI